MIKTYTREEIQALADGPIINLGRVPRGRKGERRKTTQPNGYAMPPGTGPQGETCKSCAHYTHNYVRSGRHFRKCGLNEAKWTHGPGSDVKASSPACSKWERVE